MLYRLMFFLALTAWALAAPVQVTLSIPGMT